MWIEYIDYYMPKKLTPEEKKELKEELKKKGAEAKLKAAAEAEANKKKVFEDICMAIETLKYITQNVETPYNNLVTMPATPMKTAFIKEMGKISSLFKKNLVAIND